MVCHISPVLRARSAYKGLHAAHTHARTHTYLPTYIHARTHARARARARAHTYTHIPIYIHARTHTHSTIHTLSHAPTSNHHHTHKHTHTKPTLHGPKKVPPFMSSVEHVSVDASEHVKLRTGTGPYRHPKALSVSLAVSRPICQQVPGCFVWTPGSQHRSQVMFWSPFHGPIKQEG